MTSALSRFPFKESLLGVAIVRADHACGRTDTAPRVCTIAESAERIPTGYNPYTGDIFSVADGGHE